MTLAAIDTIFGRHEARIAAAVSGHDQLEALLDLHADVARHWAEASWLRITEAIAAGSIPVSQLRPRLEVACCSLLDLARSLHARHGLDDAEALKLAAERIADEFFRRIDEVASAMAGQWGNA